MRKNVALYVVNIGKYDEPRPITDKHAPGCDFYLITDAKTVPQGWNHIMVEREDDCHRQQRRLKLMPHTIDELKDYQTTIYMDANVEIIKPITPIISTFKGGFSTFMHPSRDCVYKEGWACIDNYKAAKEIILKQMSDYAGRGIRPAKGMYQTCFLIRDNNENTIAFSERWYSELQKHSHRDQLSIICARDESGFKIDSIPIAHFRTTFKVLPHKNREEPKIHYLTPYSTDKNIGKSYNEAIEELGEDDDWIVIRDGDTLFPTPQWGTHIRDSLMKAGDYFQLIGAVTNRIGGEHQQVNGMFDIWDMREHVTKAKELQESHYTVIEETPYGVAGFFMAFRKRTWKKFKFTEDIKVARTFDTIFYKQVRAAGMRVGIMKGLYILHLYRPLSSSPKTDIKHLI